MTAADDKPFPYVFPDATYSKARINGRVVSQADVIATGVSADGHREVLGCAVGDSETEDLWAEFLRDLRLRVGEIDAWLTRMEAADAARHRSWSRSMSGGRPRTAIGTYGAMYVMRNGDRCVAETRFRDLDGRLRKVTAADRLRRHHGHSSGGGSSGPHAARRPRRW